MFDALQDKLKTNLQKVFNRGILREEHIDQTLDIVKTALLEADVNYRVVSSLLRAIKKRIVGKKLVSGLTSSQTILKLIHQELTAVLGEEPVHLIQDKKIFNIFLFIGLQGSGKTTTIAKVAVYLKHRKFRPYLVSVDVYRPAALEQLNILARENQLPIYHHIEEKKPLERIRLALMQAKEAQATHLLIDTAGRLQIDQEMMEELKAISNFVDCSEKLLILDSMMGQEALEVTKSFDHQLNLTGLIFTKADGDARGGSMLSARSITGKPIKFVGTGEKIDQLQWFDPSRAASHILGMHDTIDLIDKMQKSFDAKELSESMQRLEKKQYTFTDYTKETQRVLTVHKEHNLLDLLPGSMKKSIKTKSVGDSLDFLKNAPYIADSMTKQELKNPSIINANRKRRIAQGSGVSIPQINALLRSFQNFVKTALKMKQGKMMAQISEHAEKW